jgi:hypothetical protein
MDFGKAFVFMFQDPNWLRKLLVGTLLVLAGIVFSVVLIGIIPLLMVLGWTQVTLRNVLDGQEHPMPEWHEWGDFLVRGLKLFVALLIWLLPIVILIVPIIMGSALLQNQTASSAAGAGGGVLVTCAACLMVLWGIFVVLISPAIFVRLAAFDRFSAAFEIGELWAFTRSNIGNVILALLLLLLVSWIVVPIIGMLGLLVCLVGVLISMPFSSLWQYLVTAHLYGQIGAYGNRPVHTPTPEPIPALPGDYYQETTPAASEATSAGSSGDMVPVEGLVVPEEPATPAPEATPVETPAAEMPEVPAQETAPVEGLTVPEEPLVPVSEVFPPETPAAPEPPIEPLSAEEPK